MELNIGWAMTLTAAEDIPVAEEGNYDEQGTETAVLKERAGNYQGAVGWDGLNAWAIKGGDDGWTGEEIWQASMPKIVENGFSDLTVEATPGAFWIFPEYSEFTCEGTKCRAEVISQRVWDS